MPSEFEGRVQAKAKEIIDAGESYNYILGVLNKRYFGSTLIGKLLLISLGPGSISNSRGIHVQISGKGGSGKSEAAKKLAALVDPKYALIANVTPQALFYPIESFVDSSVVFIDDIVWKEDLGNSVKKITTAFQEGAERVVTTDGIGKRQVSNRRLTFWVTSVDNQADEQIRDRFFLVECDSSRSGVQRIEKAIKSRMAGKMSLKTDDDFETAVCHALIRDLKSWFGEVIIPFAEDIDFEGDIRALMMFLDMICSFAVFARGARKFDDEHRLEATKEDFDRAKALYAELGGHDAYKYTKSELNFLNALRAFGGKATKAQMQELLNLSLGRIGDILNGQGKGAHGLLHKCPYLSKDESQRPYVLVLSEDWSPEIDIEKCPEIAKCKVEITL
jgi:hypothetical protein